MFAHLIYIFAIEYSRFSVALNPATDGSMRFKCQNLVLNIWKAIVPAVCITRKVHHNYSNVPDKSDYCRDTLQSCRLFSWFKFMTNKRIGDNIVDCYIRKEKTNKNSIPWNIKLYELYVSRSNFYNSVSWIPIQKIHHAGM